jgi:hypothetical protein
MLFQLVAGLTSAHLTHEGPKQVHVCKDCGTVNAGMCRSRGAEGIGIGDTLGVITMEDFLISGQSATLTHRAAHACIMVTEISRCMHHSV